MIFHSLIFLDLGPNLSLCYFSHIVTEKASSLRVAVREIGMKEVNAI